MRVTRMQDEKSLQIWWRTSGISLEQPNWLLVFDYSHPVSIHSPSFDQGRDVHMKKIRVTRCGMRKGFLDTVNSPLIAKRIRQQKASSLEATPITRIPVSSLSFVILNYACCGLDSDTWAWTSEAFLLASRWPSSVTATNWATSTHLTQPTESYQLKLPTAKLTKAIQPFINAAVLRLKVFKLVTSGTCWREDGGFRYWWAVIIGRPPESTAPVKPARCVNHQQSRLQG